MSDWAETKAFSWLAERGLSPERHSASLAALLDSVREDATTYCPECGSSGECACIGNWRERASSARADTLDELTGVEEKLRRRAEWAEAEVERLRAMPRFGQQECERLLARAEKAEAEVERLRAALGEIAEGAGPFNREPLVHATNCIEAMKGVARAALRGEP